WRRFGWAGSRATRERCLTVTPACTSPSTPRPASKVMESRLGLVNEYSPLLLTAVTVAFTARRLPRWRWARQAYDVRMAHVERPADTLSPSLTPEQMRRLGYRVVDAVVDRLAGRAESAAADWVPAEELIADLGGPVPLAGSDTDAALDRMVRALAYKQHLDHPRYFARVPGPSSYAAILGDWLSTGFNATATSWATAPGPSAIEYVVLDWLRSLLGLPEGTEGVMVSGGAMANLTALAAARTAAGPGVAYLSDQTHSVLPRGLSLLGVPDA